MNKKVGWLCMVAFTFGFGILSTLVWIKYNQPPSVNENDVANTPILAYCELVENPEKYSGKMVRVSADLYWFMHGYYLADKNCASDDDSAKTAIIFNEPNRDRIFQRLEEIRGGENLDFRDVTKMIAVGEFRKVEKCKFCSDGIGDRTLLHFEINEVESAYLSNRE